MSLIKALTRKLRPSVVGAKVDIIADSIFEGVRNTTWKLEYWRAMHGEFMTHRVFSRNASSSRARPSKVVRKQILTNPAGPIEWLSNKPGMTGGEPLSPIRAAVCDFLWFQVGAKFNAGLSWSLEKVGAHKQYANRCMEPWEYIHVVASATETDNFFKLRIDPAAQPEICQVAVRMREGQKNNLPTKLKEGEYHLPFVTDQEKETLPIDQLLVCSTARCARTTFADFDGSKPSYERDLGTYTKLVGSDPMHMSPAEHASQASRGRWANMVNFKQHRYVLEGGKDLPEVLKNLLTSRLPQGEFPGREMYPHYYVDVTDYRWLDVYEVLHLFGCTRPCLQHAAKKIMLQGNRQHKDMEKDIQEAITTLQREQYRQSQHDLNEPVQSIANSES